jgi:hypothetical protein
MGSVAYITRRLWPDEIRMEHADMRVAVTRGEAILWCDDLLIGKAVASGFRAGILPKLMGYVMLLSIPGAIFAGVRYGWLAGVAGLVIAFVSAKAAHKINVRSIGRSAFRDEEKYLQLLEFGAVYVRTRR